jgi:hypothetical protein
MRRKASRQFSTPEFTVNLFGMAPTTQHQYGYAFYAGLSRSLDNGLVMDEFDTGAHLRATNAGIAERA